MVELYVNRCGIGSSIDGSCALESVPQNLEEDRGIFAQRRAEILYEKLAQAKDNNGLITGLWDGIKTLSGMGTSSDKCDEAAKACQRGEIDFEEAEKRIKEYSEKQAGSLNLFSNIAASIAALGVTAAAAASIAATGGAASPLILAAIAGGTGAASKAGFKLLDRASNNIDDDALDMKQLAKDSLSGAVTGSIAAVTMGTASSASSIMNGVVNCAKTGVKTGLLSSGANYAIDCAADEKKDFKAGEFLLTSAEGALVGGAVGAIMGGINSSLHESGILKSGCGFKKFIETNGGTGRDLAANSACTAEYKIVTDRLKSLYS